MPSCFFVHLSKMEWILLTLCPLKTGSSLVVEAQIMPAYRNMFWVKKILFDFILNIVSNLHFLIVACHLAFSETFQ